MIRIAVIEEESELLKLEKQLTEEYFRSKGLICEIQSYRNVEWFLLELREEMADIYILGDSMTSKSGLEIARKIREYYVGAVIMFVTNSTKYAVDAYEVNAYRYIIKDNIEQKIKEAYNSLLPGLMEKERHYYVTEKKGSIEKIYYGDICYLKKEGKYVIFKQRITETKVRKSLTEILRLLNDDRFLQIDKNCAVNVDYVVSLKNYDIEMYDGSILTVAKQRLAKIREIIGQYWKVSDKNIL
ncbi:MAG: LytTR family DNA-binding domain-containing protein [Eubacteriales bacterium]|nr:LytTR family DNA-binding domain-containing protein [Eubacteriales bacterium]